MLAVEAALAAALAVAGGHAAPAGQVHEGDLVLSGNDTLEITGDYRQVGDIWLSGNAVLTIRDGRFVVDRLPGKPRADIVVTGRSRLIVENAALVPPLEHPDNLYLAAGEDASIELDRATFINVINLVGGASLTAEDSAIYSSAPALGIPETAGAFGIVQACCDVRVTLTDTTVGSLGLFFGADAVAVLDGLRPGLYADWRLSEHVGAGANVGYEVALRNTRVLPVRLEGPFERGWTIFTDPAASLTVTDSTLNKLVFQEFSGETLTFEGLRLDTPVTYDFRNVHLVQTTITNQWGLFARDSDLTVRDSQGVWLWPVGTGHWTLANGTMNEYDPRGFTGTLTFAHATWRTAGEIFEGSNHVIEGTVRFRAGVARSLVVNASAVTRRLPVRVLDARGRPLASVLVRLKRGAETVRARTDAAGTAILELAFDEGNLRTRFTLTARGKKRSAWFFTDTPIVLRT